MLPSSAPPLASAIFARKVSSPSFRADDACAERPSAAADRLHSHGSPAFRARASLRGSSSSAAPPASFAMQAINRTDDALNRAWKPVMEAFKAYEDPRGITTPDLFFAQEPCDDALQFIVPPIDLRRRLEIERMAGAFDAIVDRLLAGREQLRVQDIA
jgi:hypothetical protein